MWWNRFFLINLLFVVRRDVCFLLILNCWWTSLRNDIWFEKLPIITSSFGSAYSSHKSFFHFSNMSWLLIVPGIVTITSHGISRPLELVAIYYSLLIIIVPPLLPLDDWQMHNSLATIIHCLYCKIVEWVVLVMSTFKFFTFCWYPSSSIKVETTNSSWKYEFFVVIHADENGFAFVFFTTLMWFECNVIPHQLYTEISK